MTPASPLFFKKLWLAFLPLLALGTVACHNTPCSEVTTRNGIQACNYLIHDLPQVNPNMALKYGWQNGPDMCNWGEGIICTDGVVTTIDLSNINLDVIPADGGFQRAFPDAEVANFYGNYLKELGRGAIDNTKLKDINLGGNPIDPTRLIALPLTTETLSFNNANLSRVPKTTPTPGIKYFYFDHNPVGQFLEGELDPFATAIGLSISNCGLKRLLPTTIHKMTVLQTLFADNNELEGFPDTFFDYSPLMQVFGATHNRLKKFTPGFFLGSKKLNWINLDFNDFPQEEIDRLLRELRSVNPDVAALI